MDPDGMVKTSQRLKEIAAWAADNGPTALSRLMLEGEFLFSHQNSLAWLELLDA